MHVWSSDMVDSHRAAKRIGEAQGKYKKWGPTKWIV